MSKDMSRKSQSSAIQEVLSQARKAAIQVKVLSILTGHIGKSNAISMNDLYTSVYDKPYPKKHDETRPIRKAIAVLRKKGVIILSTTDCEGGGYYLASADSEKDKFLQCVTRQAVSKLQMVAKMKEMPLSEYLRLIAADIVC